MLAQFCSLIMTGMLFIDEGSTNRQFSLIHHLIDNLWVKW